jgi:hypothetical protein
MNADKEELVEGLLSRFDELQREARSFEEEGWGDRYDSIDDLEDDIDELRANLDWVLAREYLPSCDPGDRPGVVIESAWREHEDAWRERIFGEFPNGIPRGNFS